MLNDIETICTITGQIRRRRKLCKFLFFIEIQPNDQTSNSQVFFRSDDDSLDDESFQESYRSCRPGQVVQVKVGEPHDPTEQKGKSYKVWQCNKPVVVVVPYTDREPFVQDPPLSSTKPGVAQVIELASGQKVQKSDLVCKYWVNKNPCERGERCLFQHPVGEEFEKARIQWLEEREKNRKIATHNPEDPHKSKKPHGLRAIIFAEWVRTTFKDVLEKGLIKCNNSNLESKSVILDVAGGKGEISYVLGRGFGIPSTVIEPVKRKLPNYWFTRLRRLMYRFETGTMEQPNWKSKDIQIDLMSWPCNVTPTYLHTLLDDQFLIDYADLVSTVSLFIGLHSDQATIPIVDAALKAGKAFAVVPCCVFSHDNRTRRLNSGELVTTTEQQIQYICEKDTKGRGQIKTAYLDFEGKNVVVYWIPSQKKEEEF
ncbi:hypothetical protein EDC94DRAFT_528084 [Helicostylum pulchrum]|nr:hypothetical protein EDC94DRAFT_528084 [Helicostylum pulchrum]